MPRLLLALAVLALAAAALLWPLPGAAPPTVVVRPGDTLGRLARAHGVDVDDLRAWNELDGDLIRVGEPLRVGPTAPGRRGWQVLLGRTREPTADPVADAPAPSKAPAVRRPPGPSPDPRDPGTEDPPARTWASLARPAPKPCLDPHAVDAAGDAGIGRSVGLDPEQVRAAALAFQEQTLRCADRHPEAGGDVLLELAVGCDGRVLRSTVVEDGVGVPGYAACVADVMRHAPFPAHARDEVVTRVPFRFTPAPP